MNSSPKNRGTKYFGKYYPTIEVEESDKNYFVDIDMPGVSKEDVHLDLISNTLTIKGEKGLEDRKAERDVITSERFYGTFKRRIPFSHNVDPNTVKAKMKNGVLHIELHKIGTVGGNKNIEIH